MAAAHINNDILYQPDEKPPHLTSLGLGFQSVMVRLTALAASTAIIAQASGQSESYLSWILFAALLVAGIGTISQTFRAWRFGSGYPLGVTTNTAFVAVCITALAAGGPGMLSSLIVVSALLQAVLIARLSLLRRIITPLVSGTVLMLLAATVMSVLLSRLSATPEGSSPSAAPVIAGVTFSVIMGLRMFASGGWPQWSPVIGIVTGCVVALPFGLFDLRPLIDAPWVGIPRSSWPGLEPNLSADFWALLPGFVIVTLAATIYAISDVVALQQVAWRRPRATDFRVVQGALNLIVLTNLLAAFLAGLPNTIISSNSSRVLLTGVAARRMGVYGGGILIAAAFLPKVIALLAAVPRPVFGAYIIVALAMLFAQGMKIVVQDGLDTRKAAVVGVSFWLGVGFQNDLIFADILGGTLETLLGNGLTTGALSVILLSMMLNLTSLRPQRLRTELDISALPVIDAFLREIATKSHWDDPSTERLRSAGEETLSSLLPLEHETSGHHPQHLIVNTISTDGGIKMEFVATSGQGENLEDRLAYLSEQPQILDDRELSFRLLRHYASSVQHRKYYEIDVVTVEVKGARWV